MTSVVSPLTVNPGSLSGIPGLHILANLSVKNPALLENHLHFKIFIEEQIGLLNLSKVGEVYHDFPNGGYTGVVCLTESHLSIHTWPENNYLTLDVFLSNHLKDNRSTTRTIYARMCEFFSATVLLEQIIER